MAPPKNGVTPKPTKPDARERETDWTESCIDCLPYRYLNNTYPVRPVHSTFYLGNLKEGIWTGLD